MDQGGDRKQALIEAVRTLARERLSGARAAAALPFIEYFFGHVAPRDMVDEDPEDLFGAAIALWQFGAERSPDTAKIRAYQPSFESDGWRSPRAVIEIVNDDMPFLVDSVTTALGEMDLAAHLVIHPIVPLRRADGAVTVAAPDDGQARAESFMHIQISAPAGTTDLAAVEARLTAVLADVRAAVTDWRAMRAKMQELATETAEHPPKVAGLNSADISEIAAFLGWLADDHFTFLGARDYHFVGRGKQARIEVGEMPGLGLLRDQDVAIFDDMRALGSLPDTVRAYLLAPRLLSVMKADRRATVHRPAHLDVIIVQRFDAAGKVVGETRFIGLFTSVAYNTRPAEIPFLRRKVARIGDAAGLVPNSHDHKALVNILETYPRDELFQGEVENLCAIAVGIMHLQERRQTALFVRHDGLGRFVSCLIYAPRDRFTTALRERFAEILAAGFGGQAAAYYIQMSDAVLARLHLIITTPDPASANPDITALEARLVEASRAWIDKLHVAAVAAQGEGAGNRLLARYGRAFPTAYRENMAIPATLLDIAAMENLDGDRGLALSLFRPVGAEPETLHIKLYHQAAPVPLSDILPMIENMGLKALSEIPYAITPADGDAVWIHEFVTTLARPMTGDLAARRGDFQDALAAVWHGDMEDDGFNGLILAAGLSWPEVSVLRAYARYLRQAGFTFSLSYMQETLNRHPTLAGLLIDYFRARFDPDLAPAAERSERLATLSAAMESGLENVVNLDEDRILRRFLNTMTSSLRTNFFQHDAAGTGRKPYFAVKLDSQALEGLPAPRPWVEIWVCAPTVEGVHLRGGAVARGGLRWSDRREDFRTEVLGLMKAQMVKNAVIVPVGSKGGFVVKRPPADRAARQAAGVAAYQTFIRGLLDLTDNWVDGAAVAPSRTLRHDDDDPYLVVAADKGTASFSDIANAVAAEYDFWLGDGFASGGSVGYDHKKMAITARGAWESVKRHFRERGHDIQSQDFTVVGCGDMSGDVFGNGMLLSRHIRLVAAFNHQHIFIDPTPDATAGWRERQRLFELPGSSWADYDAALISPGGGVFERAAKAIDLSPEIRAALGLEATRLTPAEVITAILAAEVDLLWFGGIGTYVRGDAESDAAVGDRANDGVRVGASQVRAQVIGEGANLGVTQQGRVDFARAGGGINTDAIDNSAGVDCSDHEVNIKILLGAAVAAGDLTAIQRDRLLADMTDEVADLVLRDNYDQTQALTLMADAAAARLDDHQALIRALERGPLKLDRRLEGLPDEEEMAARRAAGAGLTRPELAVLLAYAKMDLFDRLKASDLPDDDALADDLVAYFPDRLNAQFGDLIPRHRLGREIIATSVTNALMNRLGADAVRNLSARSGAGDDEVARAFLVARAVFDLPGLWRAVETLDNQVPAAIQTEMLRAIQDLVADGTLWFLRHAPRPLDIAGLTAAYGPGLAALRAHTAHLPASAAATAAIARLTEAGVPAELAEAVTAIDVLTAGCDITRLATDKNRPVPAVATVYAETGGRFALGWLRARAEALPADTPWQAQAARQLVDGLFANHAALTAQILEASAAPPTDKPHVDAITGLTAWSAPRAAAIARVDQTLADLGAVEAPDLAMLTVAHAQIQALLTQPAATV